MARRSRVFDKVKAPLIIVYAVVAVVFNCWVISTYMLRANQPTVITGTVASAETQEPVEGAVVGVRTPERPASTEVTTATDAEGRYTLTVPAAYENYQVFAQYGSSPGAIVSGPRRPLSGPPREGESEFQIVLHRKNTVDWEVSTR